MKKINPFVLPKRKKKLKVKWSWCGEEMQCFFPLDISELRVSADEYPGWNRLALANLWRWKCDLPETPLPLVDEPERMPGLPELRKTEWSSEFEQQMRNRLLLGAFRYKRLAAPNRPQWDRVSGVQKYLELYKKTGNIEHLVDAANGLMLEAVEGNHPNKHFSSHDDIHVFRRRA